MCCFGDRKVGPLRCLGRLHDTIPVSMNAGGAKSKKDFFHCHLNYWYWLSDDIAAVKPASYILIVAFIDAVNVASLKKAGRRAPDVAIPVKEAGIRRHGSDPISKRHRECMRPSSARSKRTT